jgi:hypothetical protein
MKWKKNKKKWKKIGNLARPGRKGFQMHVGTNWDFGQNQEPNCTLDWTTIEIQCQIKWLLDESA